MINIYRDKRKLSVLFFLGLVFKGTSQSTTSVVYTGLFKVYDNRSNVEDLNKQAKILVCPNIIFRS
jgi:hypothetical protein